MPGRRSFVRWFLYWWENAKVARERYKTVKFLLSLAFIFASLIGGVIFKMAAPDKILWEVPVDIAGNALLAVGVLTATWCLLVLPFQRHENQEKAHALEKQRLEQQLSNERFSESAKKCVAGLLNEARALQQKCERAYEAPFEEVNAWAERAYGWLAVIGEDYAARFHSAHIGTEVHNKPSLRSVEHDKLWSYLYCKMQRLDDFLRQP